MPIFEYRCQACGHQFEKLVSRNRQPACPACQSDSLEQLLSLFAVGGAAAKLSAAPSGPCGACGDPRGAGSCKIN
ncbi:MAG: FmdB family zinc ribbon protein [Candidatus Acidiferrales bacterium]